MMNIRKKLLGAVTILSLGTLFLFPVRASAAEGTQGTEIQVIQPEQLEIQLGPEWSGVEFELKTDAGMYPGTIPVGEDGVLRLEIGGSNSYVLTCLNSEVSIPDKEQVSATTEKRQDAETEESVEEESKQKTVAGIPILHLVLFGGGLVLAVGSLIGMSVMKRRREMEIDEEEDM